MLLKLINTYYIYLWLILGGIVILKTILSFMFNRNLEGFQGWLYAIFKWYSDDDKDMAESTKRKSLMGIINLLSVMMYLTLGAIILFSILPMFLTA